MCTPAPSPEYPFQLQVCDYFSLHGRNYLALDDRYSGWLTAYRVGSGNAKALVKILRQHFVTFGVVVELASDGGPQMMSIWNRAETDVKTCKRVLMENMGSQGDLDTDNLAGQCWNTGIPQTLRRGYHQETGCVRKECPKFHSCPPIQV